MFTRWDTSESNGQSFEGCQKKLRLIFAACTNKHNSWCVSIISASAPVFFSLWKNDLRQFFQQNVKGCLSGASPPCDPQGTTAIQLFITLYQPCRTDGLLFARRSSRWNHFLPDRAFQDRSASTLWGHIGGRFSCRYLRSLHFQCWGAIAMLPTSSDWTTIKVAEREFRSPSTSYFQRAILHMDMWTEFTVLGSISECLCRIITSPTHICCWYILRHSL